MTYTDELPRVSGWYWLKKSGKKAEVVEVVLFWSGLGKEWCRIGDMTVQLSHAVKSRSWRWAGPLEEPEEKA